VEKTQIQAQKVSQRQQQQKAVAAAYYI
jgi:hypothetical protein